jgi:hypothetical protein
MPTILLKKSDTPGSVPGTANLTNLAGGVEVAVNTADKRVYSMTSASAVIELGTNPSSLTCADASFTVARVGSLTISSLSLTNVTVTSATVTTLTGTSANITNISGTSLTVSTATLSGGTANGVLYLNGSKVATSGSALTFDGSSFLVGAASAAAGKAVIKDTASSNTLWLIGRTSDGASSVSFRNAADSAYNARLEGVSGQLIFEANGSEAMRLTSTTLYTASGINVGIGTSSPTTPLDVTKAGGGNFVANFQNTTSATPYGVSIKDAATPIAGYPLLQISNSAGSSVYFRVDSSTGNVGIGTSSPSVKFHVANDGAGEADVARFSRTNAGDLHLLDIGVNPDTNFVTFDSTGSAAGGYTFRRGGTDAMTLDASGNLGLGVTPSARGLGKALEVAFIGNSLWSPGGNETIITNNAYYDSTWKYARSAEASYYDSTAGKHIWFNAPSGTINTAISFTQAMTLDASGRLLVGRTTNFAGEALQIDANGVGATVYSALIGNSSTSTSVYNVLRFNQGASGSATGYIGTGGSAVGNNAFANNFVVGTQTSNSLVFNTNDTERARITSGGNLLVASTTYATSSAGTGFGTGSDAGFCYHTRNNGEPLVVNRLGSDGTLVSFQQDNVEEGTISVSGTTVSYNGGHLSRWSQFTDESNPSLVKGTVMSNLDQMAVWINPETGEPEANEQLNCMKVSDVEGDVNVAGVFVNYDDTDLNVAMTGDMIIRIAQGVVVQRGDLLMSAGDGTAKPQGDDIIRSKTVAKVTSNHVTCTYDDGSYCVPCVLTAC